MALAAIVAGWGLPPGAGAAELSLALPLQRSAYQCNERIDLAVVRSAAEGLAGGDLRLELWGQDGSELSFVFPVAKVAVMGMGARAVEHLHLNAWYLRPGSYRLEVRCDGAVAQTNLDVFPAIRRSSFKLINWGRAKGKQQLLEGEESLGFNLFYGQGNDDAQANFIRAGVDYMGCCVMSGGHQMDLRQECDWSDPYVVRGGTRRVVRKAFQDRTRPNVWGVHFYDEPGLTWGKDPATGEMTPHAVPWQLRSYEAAYGEAAPSYRTLNPDDPADRARWQQWAHWKLGLMDAAWKDAQFGVQQVRPDYVSVTQSQYGYGAFTDGYYFNVVRSLPVISGHGGYHDFGPGYFNPSMFLEFARARDLSRPNWYLPTWYSSTTADQFRLEQYLSFQCNVQGMMSPPDIEPAQGLRSQPIQGVVEANQLLGRLGTVFTTLPVTRPPVALLFSLSQFVHAQTLDRKANYAHETAHGRNVPFTYLAGKWLQHQFMPLLDEEVVDGTLVAHHRAVVLTSLDYLDPRVVAGLEAFAGQGGLVLLTADCSVEIKGAVKLAVRPAWPDADQIAQLKLAGQGTEAAKLQRLRQGLAGAKVLAEAISPLLKRAGVEPPLRSSEPGLVVTRQAGGDVEYLLAVNATHDPAGDLMLGMKAVTARLGFKADGRPIYDAIHGGPAAGLDPSAADCAADFRFGPGQMRVFARTAGPIGGVRVGTPTVRRDFTKTEAPITLELGVSVSQANGRLLSGAFPLRIRVVDPLGVARYDLYRATAQGVLNLSLPLAANDPAGEWQVSVTDLLANTRDNATFRYTASAGPSAAAGATWRAVHWPEDRAHVFRFARQFSSVTLVLGTNLYNQAVADRLTRILEPWNIRCATLRAAEASRPRPLSQAEAATWIGLDYTGRGQLKPGDQNPPQFVGFAVRGPVILLGTPEDNPLLKFAADRQFLPYRPDKLAMPGPGRGYVAWQREMLGVNQESVTLLAYDAPGLEEAVGTFYDMVSGIEPLTPLAPPRSSSLKPANRAEVAPEPALEWSKILTDRVQGLRVVGDKLSVLCHDGSLFELKADGKELSGPQVLTAAEFLKADEALRSVTAPAVLAEAQRSAPPPRLVKLVAVEANRTAIAYWGGGLAVIEGGVRTAWRQFPQDLTALAWLKGRLVAGDADGRVSALRLP